MLHLNVGSLGFIIDSVVYALIVTQMFQVPFLVARIVHPFTTAVQMNSVSNIASFLRQQFDTDRDQMPL